MSLRPASRPGAAGGHPVRSPAARRPQLSPADHLEQLSAKLDTLIRDVRLGARSQREHEEHVGRAEAIGNALLALWRKPTIEQRPVNPPLEQGPGWARW